MEGRNNNMKHILLVEDQEMVRQGLKMMLEQDSELSVVAEAENGLVAIQEMEMHLIDLIVMDIRMPEMNGIDATRNIKKRWPNVKILILTTFNDEEYAIEALKEGANGFLLKTSNSQKLIETVHSCLSGGLTLHEEVAAMVVPKLLKQQSPATSATAEIGLTPREMSITTLIGRGLTNKEIAGDLHLSVGTVKNHISQILQKLELRDRTQLAIYAVRNNIS
jgi:DNA-binding NarL/FixJ family response regulator